MISSGKAEFGGRATEAGGMLAAKDFMLPISARRNLVLCEKEHEEDMVCFLGPKLYAKAQQIALQRLAKADGGNGFSCSVMTKGNAKDATHGVLVRSSSTSTLRHNPQR